MVEKKPVHVPRDKYPELAYPELVTPTNVTGYDDGETVNVMEYWRIVIARRWTIFAILATVVTLTLIYTLKQTPIYEATASIQIDKENPNILSFKDVYQLETATDDTLRTQFEVLKSRTLARRVIESLKLNTLDEFKPERPGTFGSLTSYVRGI